MFRNLVFFCLHQPLQLKKGQQLSQEQTRQQGQFRFRLADEKSVDTNPDPDAVQLMAVCSLQQA